MPNTFEEFAAITLAGLALCLIVYLAQYRKHPLDNPAYLDLSAFRDCKLPDLRYRPFENKDAAFCQKLFDDLADAKLSPRGHEDAFVDWLNSEQTQKWIILSGAKPVACGGLTTHEPEPTEDQTDALCPSTGLSFGLMELDLQNCGLGSLLLALRLSLLRQQDFHFIHMLATEHSRTYFERFGFVKLEQPEPKFEQAEGELPLTGLGVWLTAGDQQFLDNYLIRHFSQLATD